MQLLRNSSTRNVNDEIQEQRSVLVRLTDWIAKFSGSMVFLAIHIIYFLAWLGWNVFAPADARFDEFPYGLLTLVVTLEPMIISIVLLLSQNRQVERDRVRSDIEYNINLEAEAQSARMHGRLDEHYVSSQRRMQVREQQLEEAASLARTISLDRSRGF